jgi:hypothetical protein
MCGLAGGCCPGSCGLVYASAPRTCAPSHVAGHLRRSSGTGTRALTLLGTRPGLCEVGGGAGGIMILSSLPPVVCTRASVQCRPRCVPPPPPSPALCGNTVVPDLHLGATV